MRKLHSKNRLELFSKKLLAAQESTYDWVFGTMAELDASTREKLNLPDLRPADLEWFSKIDTVVTCMEAFYKSFIAEPVSIRIQPPVNGMTKVIIQTDPVYEWSVPEFIKKCCLPNGEMLPPLVLEADVYDDHCVWYGSNAN